MSFECSGKAFIKIYRKFLEWEWYDDANTKVLFIHCLLRANWKPCKWHGVDLEPGQFVTSLASLAEETQLTVRQVRVALDHLKMTGEVTSKCQSKYRIITVNNWNCYQGSDKQNDKQMTNKRQASDKQVTTDKEYKEIEEVKESKHIYGEYKHVRLTQKQYDKLVADFGEDDTKAAIRKLDEYMQMKGKSYKDHNLVMRNWVFDAVRKDKQNGNMAGRNGADEEQHNRELDEHIARIEAGEFDAEDEELRRMWDD